MKTIRGKILFNMLGGLTALALIVGLTSSWFTLQSTIKSTEKTLTETAKVAAGEMAALLKVYETIAFETGCTARLADPEKTVQFKADIIAQKVATYGFTRGNMVDPNGISPIDGLDLSQREYFKESMKGNSWVSEPSLSKSSGKMVIMISAPLWAGGVPNTQVIGVVYFTQDVSMLIDMVKGIQVGDSGVTYVLNKQGVTIAHPNLAVVEAMENSQEQVKTDPQMKDLAALEARMIAGEAGFGEYSYGGTNKYLAFSPIDVPSKWSLGIAVGKSEFLRYTNQGVLATMGVSLLMLILFGIVSIRVADGISNPIAKVTKRLALLAQGDLHSPSVQVHTNDETQILAQSTTQTVEQLNAYIAAITMGLREIADGNLAAEEPDITFSGDFIQLEKAMNDIQQKLVSTISQIQTTARQVSSGSDQVSAGAQALSQGATEQASSIEELSATIEEITEQIKQTAQHAQNAKGGVMRAATDLTESNHKMQDMIAAMDDISKKSGEIGKIIKTIDDIAFQTNILALNAAVEAARAGAAGKGFAVVADEVRNLASKSAEAAKNTTGLIEETVKAVQRGTQIAADTAQALVGVVTGTQEVTVLIGQIADAATEQANGAVQITTGIEQISAVVQTNSATSEESAAASEELSGQAQMMSQLVGNFRLRNDENNYQR